MDLLDILLQLVLLAGALVVYLLFIKRWKPKKGVYKTIGWCYALKLLRARYFVRNWKAQLKSSRNDDLPQGDLRKGTDSFTFKTTAPDGSTLLLGIKKINGRQPIAEIIVHVKLADGTTYRLPQHPDTAVCAWEDVEGCWSASGLKIQILEKNKIYRILYNGLLTRNGDGVTQHVKLNLLWSTGSHPISHPADWSNELAAEALALEPGCDDTWKQSLENNQDGGWLRWGIIQGRFQSFDEEGAVDHNMYLRTRGVTERSWTFEDNALKNSVNILAMTSDGTGIQLRCLAYKETLTHCISGCVRFPDSTLVTVTSTDLVLSDFIDNSDELSKVYAINVGTKRCDLRLVLKINPDGGKLFTGTPYQQEIVYRTAEVIIGNSAGSGILEMSYQPSVVSDQASRIAPPRLLKWLDEKQAAPVGYCLPFEERAAACPMLVGGKGASLALLASLQEDEGYRVPPGFNLTTRALEKHLEVNPALMIAIKDIEGANEDYNEEDFKTKCEKTAELFGTTKIQGEVRDEILTNMQELRIKATEQKLGTELRFAVRSSAVGEDSEELSAAGQNDTILGCVSDEDVLHGVQKCWGSMFAFTSTYYRRQNGQACLCGGGVVIQALVSPRAAGVMFTRHPTAGDPTRLLITANYGLGESVVSGAIEPDTIIVKRGINGELTVSKTEVGTKTSRVKTIGSGIAMEDVPESERKVACLTNEQVIKLAKIGVAQEQLWGAGRDIEWAVTENEIFLLQARPITSLDRWSEEELLHELDFPVMSDDELISFGNTGEVLPKPLTPLTYDFVIRPMSEWINMMVNSNVDEYNTTIAVTHNRCALLLFNTIYKLANDEIDINIRMTDMAIHGHTVANQQMLNVAKQRYPYFWHFRILGLLTVIKAILQANNKVQRSIDIVKDLNYDIEATDAETLFTILLGSDEFLGNLSYNHGLTSTASSGSQFIAMNIFVEGKADFSPEQCNEMCSLFSSGEVLSAEVPITLAKLTQKLIASGLADDFREQDPKKAMEWLQNNIPDLFHDVNKFLDEHGHRAVMEFDLYTKPWALVPEEMIKVLQNLRVTSTVSSTKTIDEILNSLTTVQKSSTKTALRWVLPLCQRTVRQRECTKAQLILGIHKLRLGFLKLGRLLVKNWYLPHVDLVFFFRRDELRTYLRTRDPALLKKAMQRQQFYPGWCKLKFNELNTGWVKSVDVKPPQVTAGDVRIEATSVGGGEVIARACVVKDLSEIGDLREGDVLITHSTDIGWSPYFPLLTGIVTELGGLISHGAVIAREYGLPCIVGAAQATDIFQTGDIVRLSGAKGTVERVVVEEKIEENVKEAEDKPSII